MPSDDGVPSGDCVPSDDGVPSDNGAVDGGAELETPDTVALVAFGLLFGHRDPERLRRTTDDRTDELRPNSIALPWHTRPLHASMVSLVANLE